MAKNNAIDNRAEVFTSETSITATAGNITATLGDVVLTAGNLSMPTTTAAVGFINQAGNSLIHTYGTNNLFIGIAAGNTTLTVLNAVANSCVGLQNLSALTDGNFNAVFGNSSGQLLTTGSRNSVCGTAALQAATTSDNCVAIGIGALGSLLTGDNVIAIGATAGSSYVGAESNNILIGHAGVAAESGVIRIGTYPAQSATTIAGSVTTNLGITASSGNITATNGSIIVGNTVAAAGASDVDFLKSRTGGVITTGDTLGIITFQGYDGGGYKIGSQITSTSSGTIGAGRVASDLKFYTSPDSVTATTLRMTIAPTGAITIAAPDSGTALTITNGGLTVTAGSTTLTPLAAARNGIVKSSTTGVLSALIDSNTDGQVLISSSLGDPAWASLTAGANITITPGPNSISIASTASGGISWTEITAATIALVADNGYILNRAGGVAATLPATAAVGTIIAIVGQGAGGWTVAQNANQIIHFSGVDTSTGIAGSLASTNRYDSFEMICTVTDLEWVVRSSMGNITIV